MQERVPAQNIEAEQSVLSAILIDNSVIDKIAEILKSPDFYRIVHQIIYQTMLDLHAKHQPIDLITLIEELKNRNKLDDVGGVSYITLLANIVPTSANALYHARIVVNNALLRQLGESGAAITALSFEKEEDIQSLIDRAEQTLHAVSLRKHGKAFVPIHDILTHTMDRMSSLQTNGESVTGLSTGFADLDQLTTGLHPSDFIILAARPSMGKTALALNIAQNGPAGRKRKRGPQTGGLLQSGNEQRPAGTADALYRSRNQSKNPCGRFRYRRHCHLFSTGQCGTTHQPGFGRQQLTGQLPCPMEPVVGSRRKIGRSPYLY